MAANDVVLARIPIQNGEIAIKNTDVSAMVPGNSVTLDTANLLSSTQPALGAKLSVGNDIVLGVVLENIAVGGYGRVACTFAVIVPAIANAAIAAGASVGGDAAGKIKTAAAANPSFGQALTAAAGANDQVLVGIGGPSKNA